MSRGLLHNSTNRHMKQGRLNLPAPCLKMSNNQILVLIDFFQMVLNEWIDSSCVTNILLNLSLSKMDLCAQHQTVLSLIMMILKL